MKKFITTIMVLSTVAFLAYGQDTLLDFESVTDPLIEPFDVTSYESAVANPDGAGSVGKVVKDGEKFWGGINIYFGGDVQFSGTDTFKIDFYTADAGTNDSILFKFQLFNRYGGVTTVEVDEFYSDAGDATVGTWKTLEYVLPDTLSGYSYNQMVIFFGWSYSSDGDAYYFDNIVAPGFTAYSNTDVTFNITDKFDNATDVKLFVDGAEKTLTKTDNVYSNTTSLAPYTILVGESVGSYEIVYSHVADGSEVRDTTEIFVGNSSGAQEVLQLIIVEEQEDGTALAISVGTTPPTIDGVVDAVWSNANAHSNQERSWWGSPTGMYSTWKVMWDIDNIYMLYIVEDETPYNANANNYENDCVETFFDMNQSATTPYDADDFQIRTIRDLDNWTGSANVDATWAADVERGQVADANGYTIEMAIPWLSLSATFLPIADATFNYDVTVADVGALGGARLYRESWGTANDNAYFDTKDFGTVTLSALTNEGGTAVKVNEVSNLSVYPNPATGVVSINADNAISMVKIIDMTGRVINTVSNINNNNLEINVSELSSSIYIMEVTDYKGNISTTKLRVY